MIRCCSFCVLPVRWGSKNIMIYARARGDDRLQLAMVLRDSRIDSAWMIIGCIYLGLQKHRRRECMHCSRWVASSREWEQSPLHAVMCFLLGMRELVSLLSPCFTILSRFFTQQNTNINSTRHRAPSIGLFCLLCSLVASATMLLPRRRLFWYIRLTCFVAWFKFDCLTSLTNNFSTCSSTQS